MKFKIIVFSCLILFLVGLFAYQYTIFNDGKIHIVFCDVGQGDGIFIRTPKGYDILIDAGPNDEILSCLSDHMPLWDRDIELAFATHPDADHISGFQYVLASYNVKQFSTTQKTHGTEIFAEVERLLEEKQVPFRFLYKGDTYKTPDGVTIKNYWPTKDYSGSTNEDTNSFSLVQMLSYKSLDVLLTGDIEKERLAEIFPQGVSVEVFKLPHHGSNTGIDASTLQLIKANIAVISAGKNNRYHHPHPSVIDALMKAHVPFKRTDVSSDVEVVSEGKQVVLVSH